MNDDDFPVLAEININFKTVCPLLNRQPEGFHCILRGISARSAVGQNLAIVHNLFILLVMDLACSFMYDPRQNNIGQRVQHIMRLNLHPLNVGTGAYSG
ncbi:hypothetical protein D3C80_1561720 [compost metagenome]